MLADQETLSEYERLRPRYALVGQIIGARAEQGITQAQLAERVGTRQTTISRLERGEGNPTLEFMQKIATGLGKKLVIKLQ